MADGCRPRGSVEKDGRDQQAGQGDVHCDEPAQQSSAVSVPNDHACAIPQPHVETMEWETHPVVKNESGVPPPEVVGTSDSGNVTTNSELGGVKKGRGRRSRRRRRRGGRSKSAEHELLKQPLDENGAEWRVNESEIPATPPATPAETPIVKETSPEHDEESSLAEALDDFTNNNNNTEAGDNSHLMYVDLYTEDEFIIALVEAEKDDSEVVVANNLEKAALIASDVNAEHVIVANVPPAKEDAAIALPENGGRCYYERYPPVYRDMYTEHPYVANMSATEVISFRRSNNIHVIIPEGIPPATEAVHISNPIPRFKYAFANFPDIRLVLRKTGYARPLALQSQAWPLMLRGQDVITISDSGSGKTLAVILPAYAHILRHPELNSRPGAHVLIMTATKELADQLLAFITKFKLPNINAVAIYGEGDRMQQIRDVKRGCKILIGTPDRLDDLIEAQYIDISEVSFVVLYKVDRMLNAGFDTAIRNTMSKLRSDRQIIMTSCFWPENLRQLAASCMRNPVQVVIGVDFAAVAPVTQAFVFFHHHDMEDKFLVLLRCIRDLKAQRPDLRMIVFTNSPQCSNHISSELLVNCVSAVRILEDNEVTEQVQHVASASINSGEVPVILATDAAVRGLEIPGITHVINFDFPVHIDDYENRIRYACRPGAGGTAITFYTYKEAKHAKGLIQILEKHRQTIPYEIRQFEAEHEVYRKRRRGRRYLRHGDP